MKIAWFHPYLKEKGGGEKLLLRYIQHSKHDIDVYTLYYFPEATFKEFEKVNVIPLYRNLSIDVLRTFYLRGMLCTIKSWATRVDLSDYDALVVTTPFGQFFAHGNKGKIPVLSYCHSPMRAAGVWHDVMWYRRAKGTLFKRLIYEVIWRGYLFASKKTWKVVDFCACNSKRTRERVGALGLLPWDRTTVVYPAVDLPSRRGDPAGEYILYVSRFTDMKRQYELLKAWEKVHKQTDYKLVLVGGTTQRKYFAKVVKLAERLPRVEIYPNAPQPLLEELYKNADACLFLGWFEDFGIVPIEAVAWGKTLITVDSAGAMEVLGGLPSLITIPETFDPDLFVLRVSHALKKFFKGRDYHLDLALNNDSYLIHH
ncbi:MAG: glycosyltransferase family 4 protein, partial [Thermoplasmata archaeon]|nr:glycosyltransferase family 4 protein [Thermoplasmata archaeon]